MPAGGSMNLALIYSGEIRDNGTPVYLRMALKEIGATFKWYWPQGTAIPDNHDFYLVCDDGRDDIKYLPPHPCGYWAIDTHLGWDYRFRKAQHFDIVWCAQKPAAERMRAEGLNAHWLPLACYPMAHPTAVELEARSGHKAEVKYDIGFVGHLQPPAESNRVEFLDALFKFFPNFRMTTGVFHEDMARVYHQCRIGINHAVRDDLNMRFFELASIGVPQLCDRRMVGLADLGFDDGIHYIGYESTEEAIEQAHYWLAPDIKREALRDLMRIQARRLVRDQHAYVHRARTMMANIEAMARGYSLVEA